MRRYFARKLFAYGLTFFAAVTIDWLIPHLVDIVYVIVDPRTRIGMQGGQA